MYDNVTRVNALDAIHRGSSLSAVSRETGISRAALREWRDRPDRLVERLNRSQCPRCRPKPVLPVPYSGYAYLLGQYLGDGCLSRARRCVWVLRVACADSWPGVMAECASAIRLLRPGHGVSFAKKQGCTMVTAYWKHWPCLFPQHGVGTKHNRAIVLAWWQEQIVQENPGQLLRGLFHSDGCRFTNWTRQRVAGEMKLYEYPRYLFTNESADILDLCSRALTALNIEHRRPRRNVISVARRGAVAALDEFVGPKY